MHMMPPRSTPGYLLYPGLVTVLCGATLHLPEVNPCRIIWCGIQREHIVENRCDFNAWF